MVEVVGQIKDDAIIKILTRKEDVIREALNKSDFPWK